jgi:hypothetical protein
MTGLEQLWVSQFLTALAKRSAATGEWWFPSELALDVIFRIAKRLHLSHKSNTKLFDYSRRAAAGMLPYDFHLEKHKALTDLAVSTYNLEGECEGAYFFTYEKR